MSNIETILDQLTNMHSLRYTEDSSELAPMVLTLKDEVITNVFLIPDLMSPEIKPRAKSILSDMVNQTESDGYIVCSEAWMALYDDERADQTPSQRSDRDEVVITLLVTPKHEVCRIQKIIRDTDGAVTELENCKLDGAGFASVFNIYAPPKVVH